MKTRKITSILVLAGLLNLNITVPSAMAFGPWGKKVINAQVSEYKFDYVNMPWWESFNDEILTGYILKALDSNQDLKVATLKVEEFNQLAKIQFGKELPSLTTAPGLGQFKMPNENGNGAFGIPLLVSYELDLFAKNHDKTKAAKKQYEASKFDERAAYISVSSAVASTYLNLVKVDKLIAIQRDIIDYKQQIYDLMLKRNHQGITSTADTVRANKDLVLAQTELIELQKNQQVLLNALCVLTGDSPANAQNMQRIAYDDIKFNQDIPDAIPSAVIVRRPDVLRAEKNVEKAGIDVKVARKELLPSFNIMGLMAFSSSSLSSAFNWSNTLAGIGGGMLFPLFAGGQKVGNVRLKKNQYEQILQSYQKTNLVAIQEVNDALSSLKLDNEKYLQNIKKLDMEKQDFGFNEKRYKQGTISYLDLIQNKENLLDMDKTVASNKTDCLIDFISLYKATGSKPYGSSNL